jgi:hypothetical protein
MAPRAAGQLSPAAQQMMAQFRLINDQLLATIKRDRAKYLEISSQLTAKDLFVDNLLRGNHKAAANAIERTKPLPINSARSWEEEATRFGLLYLAGLKAKDAAFADTQWKQFTETLARGDRDGRYFAAVAEGKQPFDMQRARIATINPSLKRVVLFALARKFPDHAKELELLARKLDFERDDVSLCLRYVTE